MGELYRADFQNGTWRKDERQLAYEKAKEDLVNADTQEMVIPDWINGSQDREALISRAANKIVEVSSPALEVDSGFPDDTIAEVSEVLSSLTPQEREMAYEQAHKEIDNSPPL